MLQTFLGLSSGKAGLPYNMEEFQYFGPPKASSVRVEVVYPPQWGSIPEGVINTGNLRLYPTPIPFVFSSICLFICFNCTLCIMKTAH
jgi:hypothetical protein